MKLQTPLLLLASLITFASGEAASPGTAIEARSHPRDFAVGDANSVLQPFDLSKRAAPPVPAGKDGNKLHVWIRTDERPTTYDDRSGAKHDGLNQLIKDTGGRHKDVVIGNSHGHWEYGLQFEDNSWQTKPNGDGAKVADYAGEYIEVKGGHESYEYKGQVKDGRKTLKSIAAVAKTEISGKTYNHKTYNCATFAQDLVNKLV